MLPLTSLLFLVCSVYAPGYLALRPDRPNRVFCASLLGQVVGPLAVGALNDALQASVGDDAIRYSLLIIAVTPVFAGLCFWAAASSYVADTDRAANG